MSTVTHWSKLVVSQADGVWGELGEMLEQAPALLDTAVVVNGQVAEWWQYFLAAPGEEPDWDTPRGPVDWSGFARAVMAASCQDDGDE